LIIRRFVGDKAYVTYSKPFPFCKFIMVLAFSTVLSFVTKKFPSDCQICYFLAVCAGVSVLRCILMGNTLSAGSRPT